jgi:hypothetical protein
MRCKSYSFLSVSHILFSLNRTTTTKFEDLPNELILLCFNYFDFYWLYELFFCLNQRFNELISYQTKLCINFRSIPHGQFLTFCLKLNKLIKTNKDNPLSITTDDEHKLNFLLEDDLFKDQFSKLKSLTISQIKVETLYDIIFGENTNLCETLERLSLLNDISGEKHEIDRKKHHSCHISMLSLFVEFCCNLISSKMKLLKYLNLNFESYSCGCESGLALREDYVDLKFEGLSEREKSLSHLETIVIGCKLSNSIYASNLFPYRYSW